jgi:protein involved in polysaccharide export with SLBB domain
MVRRRIAWLLSLSLSFCTVLFAAGRAVSQDIPKAKPSPSEAAKPANKPRPEAGLADPAKRKALIDKMIAEYDLTPHPPAPIPDNPPPHEGALISLPYVVEPPDLILVEVLDALPGRPISGERLVRPDGKISLGFYGEIPVKGLTLPQIKVAIIKHLRKFLYDEALGLEGLPPGEDEMAIPELPENANPFNRDADAKPAKKISRTMPSTRGAGKPIGRPNSRHFAGRRIPVRPAAARSRGQEPAAQPEAPKAPPQISFPAGASGRITITIDIGGQGRPEPGHGPAGPMPETAPEVAVEEPWIIVPPEESDKVFIDVTAYNSTNYYIQGDVSVPGSLPCTGRETVLDVLQYGGGLLPTADPKQISLVRPQRGGKPARIYKVDLQAIQERGEVATNYQIFPGDRLVFGRDEVVKKTVEIDRLTAPIHTIVGAMLQEAQTLRSVQTASPDHADELYKELLDFWLKQLSSKGELKFDEQVLREALERHRKLSPPAAAPK